MKTNLIVDEYNKYSIEILGRTGLKYCEDRRSMNIDSEVLAGPSHIVIYADSVQCWDPPYNAEEVSEIEKERILNNIVALFEQRDVNIEIA